MFLVYYKLNISYNPINLWKKKTLFFIYCQLKYLDLTDDGDEE